MYTVYCARKTVCCILYTVSWCPGDGDGDSDGDGEILRPFHNSDMAKVSLLLKSGLRITQHPQLLGMKVGAKVCEEPEENIGEC